MGDPPPDQNQNDDTAASENPPDINPLAQDSGSASRTGTKTQAPSNDPDASSQGPSNHQGTDPKPSGNAQSSNQQLRINSQVPSPQGPGFQGSDPLLQGDPGSGSKGNNAEGGTNQESNDPRDDAQRPTDPSPSADSGPTPTIKWAGSKIQPGESSRYKVGVLVPDGLAVTTHGVEYSLAPSATAILTNGHEAALAPVVASQPARAPILTFAGSIYSANAASESVIAGQTLAPGRSISPSGTPIYLSPDGTVAVIGSSSSKQTLITPVPSPYAPQLTLTGSTYTADPFGNFFFIAGQTLTPGGAITVLSTPISLAQEGIVAVVGSDTQLIHPTGATAAPGLTFNSGTFAAESKGDFIIADQTLTPGGAITVSGTPVSVAAGGIVAVVGTRSQLLIHGPMITQEPIFTFDCSHTRPTPHRNSP